MSQGMRASYPSLDFQFISFNPRMILNDAMLLDT